MGLRMSCSRRVSAGKRGGGIAIAETDVLVQQPTPGMELRQFGLHGARLGGRYGPRLVQAMEASSSRAEVGGWLVEGRGGDGEGVDAES